MAMCNDTMALKAVFIRVNGRYKLGKAWFSVDSFVLLIVTHLSVNLSAIGG